MEDLIHWVQAFGPENVMLVTLLVGAVAYGLFRLQGRGTKRMVQTSEGMVLTENITPFGKACVGVGAFAGVFFVVFLIWTLSYLVRQGQLDEKHALEMNAAVFHTGMGQSWVIHLLTPEQKMMAKSAGLDEEQALVTNGVLGECLAQTLPGYTRDLIGEDAWLQPTTLKMEVVFKGLQQSEMACTDFLVRHWHQTNPKQAKAAVRFWYDQGISISQETHTLVKP